MLIAPARTPICVSRSATHRVFVFALLICATLGVILTPTSAPRAGDLGEAVGAVEACLTANRDGPTRCQDAAAPFCADPSALTCKEFEIKVWRRVAAAAEAKLETSNEPAADPSFVAAAAEDLAEHQRRACQARSQSAAAPKTAFAQCLQRRVASRAIALWTLAAAL